MGDVALCAGAGSGRGARGGRARGWRDLWVPVGRAKWGGARAGRCLGNVMVSSGFGRGLMGAKFGLRGGTGLGSGRGLGWLGVEVGYPVGKGWV